jgi:hypothetical protein
MLGLLVGAQFQSSNPLYQVLENLFLGHLGFWESIISAEVFLFMLGAARFEPKRCDLCAACVRSDSSC